MKTIHVALWVALVFSGCASIPSRQSSVGHSTRKIAGTNDVTSADSEYPDGTVVEDLAAKVLGGGVTGDDLAKKPKVKVLVPKRANDEERMSYLRPRVWEMVAEDGTKTLAIRHERRLIFYDDASQKTTLIPVDDYRKDHKVTVSRIFYIPFDLPLTDSYKKIIIAKYLTDAHAPKTIADLLKIRGVGEITGQTDASDYTVPRMVIVTDKGTDTWFMAIGGDYYQQSGEVITQLDYSQAHPDATVTHVFQIK